MYVPLNLTTVAVGFNERKTPPLAPTVSIAIDGNAAAPPKKGHLILSANASDTVNDEQRGRLGKGEHLHS